MRKAQEGSTKTQTRWGPLRTRRLTPRAQRGPQPAPRRLSALRRLRTPPWLAELILDVAMLAVATTVAELTMTGVGLERAGVDWMLGFAAVVLVGLWAAGAYRPRLTPDFFQVLRAIIGSTAIAAMSLTFIEALSGDPAEAAQHAVRAWLIAAVYLVAGRAGYEFLRRRLRRHGALVEPALIAGAGTVGRTVAARLLERSHLGLRPVAYLDDAPLPSGGGPDLPVVGFEEDRPGEPGGIADRLEYAVRTYGARHLIMTFSLRRHDAELEIVKVSEQLGVSVSLVPRLFESFTDKTSLERLGGLPLITVHPSNPKGVQYAFKYVLGRLLAAIMIVAISPFLVAARARGLDLDGPAGPLPPGAGGPRRQALPDAQVPDDAQVAVETASEQATAEAMARGDAVAPGGSRATTAAPRSAASCGDPRSTRSRSS